MPRWIATRDGTTYGNRYVRMGGVVDCDTYPCGDDPSEKGDPNPGFVLYEPGDEETLQSDKKIPTAKPQAVTLPSGTQATMMHEMVGSAEEAAKVKPVSKEEAAKPAGKKTELFPSD